MDPRQGAMPAVKHSKLQLLLQEQEKLVREVMRHVLFRQKAQPDVPVPRNDLTKLILASYKDVKKSNVSNAIIALAQASFAKVMGMELRELRVAPISKGKSRIAGNVRCGHPSCTIHKLAYRLNCTERASIVISVTNSCYQFLLPISYQLVVFKALPLSVKMQFFSALTGRWFCTLEKHGLPCRDTLAHCCLPDELLATRLRHFVT